MKTIIFQISDYDIGKYGIKRSDLGRWILLTKHAIHIRDSYADCLKMRAYIED